MVPRTSSDSPTVVLFPALAGFQSEHAVEIPFMLTSEDEDSETTARGSKTRLIEKVWEYSGNWKRSGEGFS